MKQNCHSCIWQFRIHPSFKKKKKVMALSILLSPKWKEHCIQDFSLTAEKEHHRHFDIWCLITIWTDYNHIAMTHEYPTTWSKPDIHCVRKSHLFLLLVLPPHLLNCLLTQHNLCRKYVHGFLKYIHDRFSRNTIWIKSFHSCNYLIGQSCGSNTIHKIMQIQIKTIL